MKKVLILAVSCLSMSGVAWSATKPAPVAVVTGVEGSALIENTAGQRRMAKLDAPLQEGEHLLVLENGKVNLKYLKSACQSLYEPNTLLKVSQQAQCAPGQTLAVGEAANPGSNPIVDTLVDIGENLGFANEVAFEAGVAALGTGVLVTAAVVNAANDDDDENKERPVSSAQ